MALKGRIENEGELVDVIQMIHTSRWTGALHVLASDGRRTVFFKDGDVRAAASDAREERLGELLCRHGAITRAELEAALERPSDQKRLGAVLVQRRLITTHDLYFYIRKQMEEVFLGLLLVSGGEFYFHRRDLPESLPAQLHLFTHELLLDGMERVAELARFRQEIPSLAVVLERMGTPEDEGALPAAQQALLESIDGVTSLGELATRGALGEYHAIEAAFRLLEQGYVQPGGAHRRQTGVSDPQRLLLEPLVAAFNDIFARLHAAAQSMGEANELVGAARSFFEEGTVRPALFRGVELDEHGRLDVGALLDNLRRATPEDPPGYLYAGLDELLFFETFVVGEPLPDDAERALKERLEEIRNANRLWR